jgi:hypothetical protein
VTELLILNPFSFPLSRFYFLFAIFTQKSNKNNAPGIPELSPGDAAK